MLVEAVAQPPSAADELQAFIDAYNSPDVTISFNPDDENYLLAIDYSTDPPTVVADYSNLAPQLEQLYGYDEQFLSVQDWMAENGIEMGDTQVFMDAMTQMLADMGEIDADEEQQALDYAAQTFGMDSTEYQALLARLTARQADTSLIEGYSPELMQAKERAIQRDLAERDAAANRMVNNIMSQRGCMTAALSAADTYTNNINNYAIQAHTQLIEDDFAAKQANIQSEQQFWGQLVSAGQMAKGEYLDRMMQAEANVFQGYATQMNGVLQQNQQYLQMYSADLDAISRAMDATYNGVMATLGVNEAVLAAKDNYLRQFYEAAGWDLTELTTILGIADTGVSDALAANALASAEAANDWSQVAQAVEWVIAIGGILVAL